MSNIEERLDRIERLVRLNSLVQKKVLTTKEAAIYLSFKESYIHKLTAGNKIPFSKPNGKTIYILREDLDKWMQKNRSKSIDEISQEVNRF